MYSYHTLFRLLVSVAITIRAAVSSSDNYAILTLFNKGYELPDGKTCTDEEWIDITSTIDAAAYGRRKLQHEEKIRNKNNLRSSNQNHRQLKSYTFCYQNCYWVAPGKCYILHPSCAGTYDRFLTEEEEEIETNIETSESVDCLNKVNQIKYDLNILKEYVSSDCQEVLSSSQDFICSDVYLISSWNLWNGLDDTIIMEKFEDGGSLCLSTKFNIEAVVDDEDRPNIEKVSFKVTGPNGYEHKRTEFNGQFMMFGNSGSNIFGENLSDEGIYTLVATPNDDPYLARSLTFTLNDC